MADISVICALWSGNFKGGRSRMYSPVYISRLKDMLTKHTTKELDFVCFSNWPKREFREDIRVIPLERHWPAWWSKVEMFRPGMDLENRVLAMDIDVIIVGDMDEIIDFDAELAIADYWAYSGFRSKRVAIDRSKRKKDGLILIPQYSSDVIIYNRGMCERLYTEFDPKYMGVYCGDQDWVAACMGNHLPMFPRTWMRRLQKYDRELHSFGETKLIACHPVKNHDLRRRGFGPLADIWEGINE